MSDKDILIRVELFAKKADCTFSKVYVRDKFFCYSIEDEIRDKKVHGETAIPEGVYKLALRQSPKFSSKFLSDSVGNLYEKDVLPHSELIGKKEHDLIWVKDVPNFNFILIHWGNFDTDTEGCLIVGDRIGTTFNTKKNKIDDSVLNSKVCYKRFYKEVYKEILKGDKYIQYIRK